MMRKQYIYIILALFTLPVILFAQKQIQKIISQASPQPANIVIDTKNKFAPLRKSWASFAQGGEEPPPMLSGVAGKLRELKPQYIRLDHIYDSYSIVQKSDKGFVYDFSRLDKTVDDIITAGALPFFSLSYMPSVFTASGSIIDTPRDWNDWKNLVKATIEHYSGKNNRNLTNVYYEVWNEPELPQFGQWKLSPEKDYRILYFNAAMGASEATNTNNFYLGGPAVGSYYPSWIKEFVSYIVQNNLRLDFYSWHRYSKKPEIFVSDARSTRNLLSKFSSYASIPLVLSEWGIESENNQMNNTSAAAAFTITSISKFHNDLQLAFTFEVKDGPPPSGGKWGLFTHEKDTNSPLSPKFRTQAFSALSKMEGNQLNLVGEGTFISGLAAYSSESITVILSNYDLNGKNTENVPITFTGLSPSSYLLKYSYPLEQLSGSYELISTNGTVSKTFLMSSNSILVLTLTHVAKLATFIPGVSLQSKDQALVVKNADNPLIFASPEFRLLPFGSISFDIKPFWEEDDDRSFLIFEAPYSTTSGIINKLFLAKQKTPGINNLVFGVAKDKEEFSVSLPLTEWKKDKWHHINAGWDQTGLSLSVDNELVKKIQADFDIHNGRILYFYPIDAALDNLKIVIGDSQVILRQFNGRLDK